MKTPFPVLSAIAALSTFACTLMPCPSHADEAGHQCAEEMRADSLLKAMDRNQSKTIELEEWLAAYAPLFQEYDRNNDGQLVLAEMAPWP